MIDYEHSALFTKNSVDKQLTIKTDDESLVITNLELNQENFELTESICSESELKFGCCEASSVKFRISDVRTSLKDKWLTITEVLDGNSDTPFQFGRYKVFSDKPTADKRYRDIVAYDAMYDIINADVAQWYNTILPTEDSTVAMKEFRTSFISYFGLEQEDVELANDSMIVEKTIVPLHISGKDVISAICELNGCFGHIGRDGKFKYVLLSKSEDAADFHCEKYISCDYEDYITSKIAKLQIRQAVGDIGVTVGGIGNCYVIEDNFLVYGKSADDLEEIAINILGVIEGIYFRPFSAVLKGNPCFEVGDCIKLSTKYSDIESYILKRTLSGIQALRDTYEADGGEYYTEKLNSMQNVILQIKETVDGIQWSIDEADIRYVKTEELDVIEANISSAVVESIDGRYATFDLLNAVSARVGTLEVTALTANSAIITELQSGVAKVNNLIFGAAGGTSIQTEFSNSVIAMLGDAQIKSAMIEDVSADKVKSGSLYTNLVHIYGDESEKLSIVDNTISISDGTRTRVQIGKDASNDYNMYVWDKSGNLMFDALGLTEDGITRQIIRDDVVKDDANINAAKLDIDSLFTEINGSSNTIKSTKVYFDSEKQTLDAVFETMTTTVEGLQTTQSSQGTQITAIQGQISSKIWQQDIDTAVDDVESDVTTLSTQYSTLNQTVTGLSSTVGSHTTQINSLDTRVDSAGSSITQLSSEILLKVDKKGVIGAINLSSEEALIQAEKINLVGAVTFSSLDSSTQNKIDTASTNASTAISTANTANTNANTALSTANSALETANNVTPFIKGTQTAATGAWTGVAPFASLVDGQQITYWLPYAGSGNATLNLTLSTGSTTGAVECYYGGATRLTTHYPAGSAIRLTYRKNVAIGSATYTGWWADANYDSGNTYDRIRYSGTVKASAAIVAGNIIVGDSSGYHHLKTGGTFDVSYPILYAGSAIASGGTGSNNYLAIAFAVATTQSVSLTAYKAVYIKGTLNGSIFTPISTAPLTQTVPTSDDGYYYILLGTAYAATAIYLATEHPIYRYKNGAFKTTAQISSEIAAWAWKNDVMYIDGGKIYASEAFIQNIFSKDITATGTIKGVTLISSAEETDAYIEITNGDFRIYDDDGGQCLRCINGYMSWLLPLYNDSGEYYGVSEVMRVMPGAAPDYYGVGTVVDIGMNSSCGMEIGVAGAYSVADPYVSINIAGEKDVILYGPLSALDIDCINIVCTDVRIRNGISLSELNSNNTLYLSQEISTPSTLNAVQQVGSLNVAQTRIRGVTLVMNHTNGYSYINPPQVLLYFRYNNIYMHVADSAFAGQDCVLNIMYK